ncbi:MAG TPA: nucleotidyltransferase domain-containing protein [Candidatus Hydrogenedentes bacterium]|nr:nucleotidyltransferase domain-containing protein [Candidatus Hydrogenedentota bacterium]
MVDNAVIETSRRYLQQVEKAGIPVRFGVLFGSHVTGNIHQWSDIDVLVVSSLYDDHRNYETVGKLWRIAHDTDNRIEPIACGARQWEEDHYTPIVEIARAEGIIIKPDALEGAIQP